MVHARNHRIITGVDDLVDEFYAIWGLPTTSGGRCLVPCCHLHPVAASWHISKRESFIFVDNTVCAEHCGSALDVPPPLSSPESQVAGAKVDSAISPSK